MAVDSCDGPVQGVSTSSRVQVWCFGGYPTVDSQWQPLGLSGRVVGRFRGGDTIASLGGGVLAIQHGGQRLPAVEEMFQQRSLTRAITSHRA